MEIELLFIDGCPSYPGTLDLLKEILKEGGFEVPLRVRCIGTEQEAKEAKFLGSPTLRINGMDIETGADGRDNYGLSCRVYRVRGRQSGVPPKGMIWQAILRVSLDKGRSSCC